MDTPIIHIDNVSFSYNGESVLEDINLKIRRGDFTAVIGPNGSGKTTLFKLILGLLKPGRGDIRVLGKNSKTVSSQIGYVPQDVHINGSFPITVMDVVKMGLLGQGKRGPITLFSEQREVMEALHRMKIGDLARRKIGSLSGGQRQRVFIARALMTKPELMLLDEPTANIDARGQSEFFALLKELNREVTILVISHNLPAVSHYVKSIACVNRHVHYHNQSEITEEILKSMYSCTVEEVCPVQLVPHESIDNMSIKHRGVK